MSKAPDKVEDTTEPVDTARQEVVETQPARAPLPDPAGLANSLSPVDLPEPDRPLAHPLRWTIVVMAVAGLVLALFNAHSLRSWAYGLKPGPINEPIVTLSEGWYDFTAALGLAAPSELLRGDWEQVKAAGFSGQAPDGQNETGPDAGASEPVK